MADTPYLGVDANHSVRRVAQRLLDDDTRLALLEPLLLLPDTCGHCRHYGSSSCLYPGMANPAVAFASGPGVDFSLTCEIFDPIEDWRAEIAKDVSDLKQRRRQRFLVIAKQHMANAKLSHGWCQLLAHVHEHWLSLQYSYSGGDVHIRVVKDVLVGSDCGYGSAYDKLRQVLHALAQTEPDLLCLSGFVAGDVAPDGLLKRLGYSRSLHSVNVEGHPITYVKSKPGA